MIGYITAEGRTVGFITPTAEILFAPAIQSVHTDRPVLAGRPEPITVFQLRATGLPEEPLRTLDPSPGNLLIDKIGAEKWPLSCSAARCCLRRIDPLPQSRPRNRHPADYKLARPGRRAVRPSPSTCSLSTPVAKASIDAWASCRPTGTAPHQKYGSRWHAPVSRQSCQSSVLFPLLNGTRCVNCYRRT